jgi:hypothetical protein
MNLDIANGQCRNDSIPQNVTFSEQGGPLSGGSSAAVALNAKVSSWFVGALVSVAVVMGLF